MIRFTDYFVKPLKTCKEGFENFLDKWFHTEGEEEQLRTIPNDHQGLNE